MRTAFRYLDRLWAALAGCMIVIFAGCDSPVRPTGKASDTSKAERGPTVHKESKPYRPEPEKHVVIRKVRVLPDNERVVTMSDDRVTLWELSKTYKYRGPSPGPLDVREFVVAPAVVYDMDVSPDGSRVLIGCSDGVMRLLDLMTGRQIDEFFTGERNGAYLVAFRTNGKQAVTVSVNGHAIRVWDLQKHELIEEYAGPETGEVTIAGGHCLAV